jgi:hypothetical protein
MLQVFLVSRVLKNGVHAAQEIRSQVAMKQAVEVVT